MISVLAQRFKQLNLAMEEMGGKQRYYVDTGPVLERDFASDAGAVASMVCCVA